jgi:glyoxylase-like metal-dependent hydrolase (beta-lactamase superfamily II)
VKKPPDNEPSPPAAREPLPNATRRQFLGGSTRLAVAASLSVGTLGVITRAAQATMAPEIRATTLAPGFTLLDGAGCNVLALKGPEGSLLVDGGYAKNSKLLLAAAAKATGNRKIARLFNTHWHPAQTGSNETVGRDGGLIIAHEVTKQYLSRPIASIDYDGLYGPLTEKGRPCIVTRTTGSMEFHGQPVEYGCLPAAHTSGDLYVHFPAANILVAGGPVNTETWPLLDWRNGASLDGLVKAYEKLLALARPDTLIVPSNGRVITGAELKQQHQMYAAFHEQMVAYRNRGFDSGHCIAARPLQACEAQLGDAGKFIHGAFQSLNLA